MTFPKVNNNLLNTGNAAGQLVKLDALGKLPALDASQLINIPGGNALSLLDTRIANNVAQVDFTSGIDATYDAYLCRVINASPSSSGSLRLRVSSDGGVNYKPDTYYWCNDELRADPAPAWSLTGSTTSGSLDISKRSFGSGEYICNDIILYKPSLTTIKKLFTWQGASLDSGYNKFSGGGAYVGSNEAINALRIFFSGGNIASGIFKLYGLA